MFGALKTALLTSRTPILGDTSVDWWAQGRYRDLWQEYARRAFEQIDTDGSGCIEREELVAYLANKLSPYEVPSCTYPCRASCMMHYLLEVSSQGPITPLDAHPPSFGRNHRAEAKTAKCTRIS